MRGLRALGGDFCAAGLVPYLLCRRQALRHPDSSGVVCFRMFDLLWNAALSPAHHINPVSAEQNPVCALLPCIWYQGGHMRREFCSGHGHVGLCAVWSS